MIDVNFFLDKHRELDLLIENSKNKTFISDWNCHHPYYKKYFNEFKLQKKQIYKYNYIRSQNELTVLISKFHYSNNEPKYLLNEIITSNGSTTIISAFFIWLVTQNINEVYYIPPIYFTFHFYSKTFNISLRPISKSHLFEKNSRLNLPNKKTILIITDPIWYCGYSVPE